MTRATTDVIVIGAGLSGLIAALEVVRKGKQVILLDQEGAQNIGGQAWWSLGGLFLVDTPEQRRMGIRDSYDLAWQDWIGTAAFDREADYWPRKWAAAYVHFAAGEKRHWLREQGIRFFPVVGWAERGGYGATGHGNSVPRFHIAWGTGTGIVAPFADQVQAAVKKGALTVKFRHRVQELPTANGVVTGVSGAVLAEDKQKRGEKSPATATGTFTFHAQAVIVASGGMGANHELVRKNWPERLGSPPVHMISGVPDYVDGSMIGIAQKAGGHLINADRMWHYTEGVQNWDPVWSNHGIRILPGPTSLWFDARGNRLPAPYFPGYDTLGTLRFIRQTGYDYSWFILNQKIIKKEFALSGSEQNPDLTNKSWRQLLKRAVGKKATPPVEAFKGRGADFIVRDRLEELVNAMNDLAGNALLPYEHVAQQIKARDREMDNKFCKDLQVIALYGARRYLGDRLIRTAKPHKILDPQAGPLIAVRLHVLTRKTLGGLETNLSGAVLDAAGNPVPGLYAAGEVSGFGGGGMHGYRALEGTFLGGCIFSGRIAGRAVGARLL